MSDKVVALNNESVSPKMIIDEFLEKDIDYTDGLILLRLFDNSSAGMMHQSAMTLKEMCLLKEILQTEINLRIMQSMDDHDEIQEDP